MRWYGILILCFGSSFYLKAQCDSLTFDVGVILSKLEKIESYEERKNFLADGIEKLVECDFQSLVLEWQMMKISIAQDENLIDDQIAYLKDYDQYLKKYKAGISINQDLNFQLYSMSAWSEINYLLGSHTKSIAQWLAIEDNLKFKFDTLSEPSKRIIVKSFRSIGFEYFFKNELELAIIYLKKAYSFSDRFSNIIAKKSSQSIILGVLSEIYIFNGERELARKACENHNSLALQLIQFSDKYEGHLHTSYNLLAEWNIHYGSFEKAIFYLEKIKKHQKKYHYTRFEVEILESKINKEFGNTVAAYGVLRDLIASYGGENIFLDQLGLNLGNKVAELFIELDEHNSAIKLLKIIDFRLQEEMKTYKEKEIEIFHSKDHDRLNLLINQISTIEIDELELAIIKLDEAFSIIEKGFRNISMKYDKFKFASQSVRLTSAFFNILPDSTDLFHSVIFKALELSKSAALFSAWKQKQYYALNSNDDVFNQEQIIQDKLGSVSKQFLLSNDSTKSLILKNEINLLNVSLDSIKSILKDKHLAYYKMKYDWQNPELEDLQAVLHNDEVYINYFEGEKSLYAMLISSDSTKVIKIEALETVQDLIDQYSNSILTPFALGSAQKINNISYLLYEHLLAPLADELKNRIIISPSGSLNQVPFSALRQNKDPGIDPLLIAQHAISYTPSASLFHQERTSENDQKVRNALLIAPKFTKPQKKENLIAMRSSLGELIYNIPEVEMISSIVNNNLLTNENATKQAFLNKLENSDLLHFATHAKSNEDAPDRSFIAFYSGDAEESDSSLLYLDELSKLYIPAKMVVLSACETGLGKIYKGEGTMSLANACFYGGSHSVIASLWSVQDKTTSEIMKSFYRYLDEGQAKDKAMQLAKLDYLDTNSEDFHHPFFWAGFTVIGNTEALHFKKAFNFRLGF